MVFFWDYLKVRQNIGWWEESKTVSGGVRSAYCRMKSYLGLTKSREQPESAVRSCGTYIIHTVHSLLRTWYRRYIILIYKNIQFVYIHDKWYIIYYIHCHTCTWCTWHTSCVLYNIHTCMMYLRRYILHVPCTFEGTVYHRYKNKRLIFFTDHKSTSQGNHKTQWRLKQKVKNKLFLLLLKNCVRPFYDHSTTILRPQV